MAGAINERPFSSTHDVTLPEAGVGSDAKSTRFPLEGIHLTVHILGSRGCGKSTLYKQWCDSSVCEALSRFADVQMKLEVSNAIQQTAQLMCSIHKHDLAGWITHCSNTSV